MSRSKLVLNLLLGFFVVSCQSTRVIYQQQVGPNHKDEFAVLAHHDEIYFFTLDCHDSNCQIRECSDSSYTDCPNLVAECKNDELKLMKFKNSNDTTSEVRICKNFEKKFMAKLEEIGLTRFAKLTIKGSFEGSIAKDDLAKALDKGYKVDLRSAHEPSIVYEKGLDTARCVYSGAGASELDIVLDTDSKTLKLTGPQGKKVRGLNCTLPYMGRAIEFLI